MKSVLIVDFFKENLQLTRGILKPKYEVYTADSLKSAIDVIVTRKPDVVLINYIIPGTGGVTILNSLQRRRKKDFLAIMMSNVKDMDIVVDAVLRGFDGFIKIPVAIEKFGEQIKKARKIHKMRSNANKYIKSRALKTLSITFAHYTRNLLTPLIGYLSKLQGNVPDNIYNIFSDGFSKINKLTYKMEEMIRKGEFNERSFSDNAFFFDLELDD